MKPHLYYREKTNQNTRAFWVHVSLDDCTPAARRFFGVNGGKVRAALGCYHTCHVAAKDIVTGALSKETQSNSEVRTVGIKKE